MGRKYPVYWTILGRLCLIFEYFIIHLLVIKPFHVQMTTFRALSGPRFVTIMVITFKTLKLGFHSAIYPGQGRGFGLSIISIL